MGLKTDKFAVEASQKASIKAPLGIAMESVKQISLKGTQVAIGNDQFELFEGLDKLITALGAIVVTSPVGTCTPIQAAPTWATDVLPLQLKIKALISSLASAESVSPSDEGDVELATDVGS
jgi:hypothetical protein